MSFALRLREERKRLGLSQCAAASLCGISRESWGKYERGVATPGLVAFQLTGIDVAYVLTGQRHSSLKSNAALSVALIAIRHAEQQLAEARIVIEAAMNMAEDT